jgi:hypothetical protein
MGNFTVHKHDIFRVCLYTARLAFSAGNVAKKESLPISSKNGILNKYEEQNKQLTKN